MADIMLFDPILIPDITVLNGSEKLAALQGSDNKQLEVDLLVSFINPFIEFRGRIFQTGTGVPSVQKTFKNSINAGSGPSDPTYALVTFIYVGVGQYALRLRYNSSNTLINSSNCEFSLSDGKCRMTGVTNGSDGVSSYIDFAFSSYQPDGTLANGVITYTNVYLRQY
jgi:hypothetical protein